MRKIAYVIGHRNSSDPKRLTNLLIVLKWLANLKIILLKHDIIFKIVVVEQDDSPKIKEIQEIQNKIITHIFVYNPGLYNRGWGFNVGFREVNADYYFFADNDIILQDKDAIHVFEKCFKYDAVNPYIKIYDSTEEFSTVAGQANLFGSLDLFSERKNICFSGGIVGLNKKSVRIISGWDERFRGRGWEDYVFTAKLKLFLYNPHTFKFNAIHLWHKAEEQTSRVINRELNEKYQIYGVYDYIKQIEKSHDFGSPLKYSKFGIIQNSSRYKFKDFDRIDYAFEVFNKIYKYVTKRYEMTKHKKRLYTYLYLCDQLENVEFCESSCVVKESGCVIKESGCVIKESGCCDNDSDSSSNNSRGSSRR